jgi:hypothetical protein
MAKILTPFVIGVGEHEENILQDWDEELLEEDICSLGISLRHVVDELDTHRESSVLDLSVVVLARPHAGINDEFELALVKSQQRGEAVIVDRLKELKELHSMFRILVEVLIDHVESAFEHVLHDDWDFVFHHALQEVSVCLDDVVKSRI